MARIPVIKNQEYEIQIDNIGVNGEGIGRINDFTMFIPGALPGEKVKIKAIKVGKSYGYGKLLNIIETSPDRVEPLCPYVHRCGGCQLQHISYPMQLKLKRQLVIDAVERIGKLKNPRVLDTIGMQDPWYYRNKMQFPVGLIKDKLAIGFYAPRSHNIIDMNSCYIQHPVNDIIIKVVRKYMDDFKITPYDEKSHQGTIRYIVSKVGFRSGQIMVIIVTNGDELPYKKELINEICNKIPGVSSIIQNIKLENTNVIFGNKNIVLWGEDHIIDWIDDLKFRISPMSFFQVNPFQTPILYEKAVEYAGLTGKEKVIDAYCGIGTISLFMAKKAEKVYGIEIVPQAVEDAKTNAIENNIHNAQFYTGEAEALIPKMVREGLKFDVAVVDPPRKGCDAKLLDALVQAQPDRIVYVSCNPATLARDLAYLGERGYGVVEIQPVDMFAQTAHVECVTLMSRIEE